MVIKESDLSFSFHTCMCSYAVVYGSIWVLVKGGQVEVIPLRLLIRPPPSEMGKGPVGIGVGKIFFPFSPFFRNLGEFFYNLYNFVAPI